MSKHNAKEWIGILNAFQDAGYLSIKTFLKLSEGGRVILMFLLKI
tara:strand:- start:509 stop:643 length:135 start_codon:yes stop_codon:yes gene_type:complete